MTQQNQLATQPEGVVSVRSLLNKQGFKKRFEEVLGARANQFCASITNQCASGLLAEADPTSVLAAGFIAASLDLTVDRNLGLAWIIPYKTKVQGRQVVLAQFQMGYRGFIQLALRSGQYKYMNATVVNKEAYLGRNHVGEANIDWEKIDDTVEAPYGYAIVWELVNGFRKTFFWTDDKVRDHAQRYSQSFKGGYNSPWKTHYREMALKTVIANGLKAWGILSIELQKAVTHDGGTVIDFDSAPTFPDQPNFTSPELTGGEEPKNPKEPSTTEEKAEKAETKEDLDLGADNENFPPLVRLRKKVTENGVPFDIFLDVLREEGVANAKRLDDLSEKEATAALKGWTLIEAAIAKK